MSAPVTTTVNTKPLAEACRTRIYQEDYEGMAAVKDKLKLSGISISILIREAVAHGWPLVEKKLIGDKK